VRRSGVLLCVVTGLLAGSPARAAASSLRVGVGRADITGPTGVYKGGWACECARADGQHTRLFARAVVIDKGAQKVALVAADLAFTPAGMIRDAAAMLPGRGFSEQNIIDSATHTHGSQSGFMNFPAYNTILPRDAALVSHPADPLLYSFMARQLAAAIRRADDNLEPGAIGWGKVDLLGVTQNRSLEAHLANYGIHEAAGTGDVSQAPGGYPSTIDPAVDVLRVDQYRRAGAKRRRVPVGVFSTFANHGTVVKEDFCCYSADHQASAERVVESAIRRAGRVPKDQDVVNAFANGDAGDMSAGLTRRGAAWADEVGRREAAAMLDAWSAAGRAMTRDPVIAIHFTRVCACGQMTSQGPVDSSPILGAAAVAGSEEGRTLFYDTGTIREGTRLPAPVGPQGSKIPVHHALSDVPHAAPLTALRIGDRLMVTYPGEPTVGVGRALRDAVRRVVGGSGIAQIVVVGYANEYGSYWTTPAEYEEQHYEGGSTGYGRYASILVQDALVDLAGRLVSGRPAPDPHPYDPNNGLHATADDYGGGAATGVATAQPGGVMRLGHATFAWKGGANGIDRRVDAPFVTVQRRDPRGWRAVADDIGVQILWESAADGAYKARWEAPLSAKPATYRFHVTAKRYVMDSSAFAVAPTNALVVTPTRAADGRVAVRLAYPAADEDDDVTYRPSFAAGGRVAFTVDGRSVTVRRRKGTAWSVQAPAGATIRVAAGAARDRYGNTNSRAITVPTGG
jgi:neutral ceramidase